MAWQNKLFITATVLALTGSTLVLTNTISWASGVSVGSEAVTVADNTAGAPQSFDASISNALVSLQNSGDTNSTSVQTFYDSYKSAQDDYQTAVSSAVSLYNSTFVTDPTSARAALVANLKAARDTFVTAVSDAKDRLVTELNGGATTSAGEAFKQTFSTTLNQYVSSSNGLMSQMKELPR